MNTISDLRKALGLSTTNQVRNRIEAIKDILSEYLRRGPNNQILITDDGVALLRRLQDLYDSGLTMAEASEILRNNANKKPLISNAIASGFVSNRMNAGNDSALIAALKEEIAFLRERVAFLEEECRGKGDRTRPPAWWEGLREDL
jgi:hypothetical protein